MAPSEQRSARALAGASVSWEGMPQPGRLAAEEAARALARERSPVQPEPSHAAHRARVAVLLHRKKRHSRAESALWREPRTASSMRCARVS